MAPQKRKCCVGNCASTSNTHRLFCMPRSDNLRNLWMSFLVPTNAHLLNLTKYQLLEMRVCERHFDQEQFDIEGKRRPDSYPCLFTEDEIALGEPLSSAGDVNIILSEHNYFTEEDDEVEVDESNLVIGKAGEDYHEHPSCSYIKSATAAVDKSGTQPQSEIHPHEYETITCEHSTKSVKVTLPHSSLHSTEAISRTTRTSKKGNKFINQCKRIATKCVELNGTERIQKAEKLVSEKKLFENFNLLSKPAQTLLLMQLRNCTMNKKARRFALQEKLMALLLLKQSPKEYKLLEYMFSFPTKRTLHRLAEKVNIEPGLNPEIFIYLENKVKEWDTQKKLCTIVFDEVSLTPHLTYNEKNDKILGFVDSAGERQQKFCDHALIFMIRGICSSWRQSVAFYFCEGTTPAAALQNILKQLVQKITQAGLIPLGLVCDQGSTFRTALKKLRDDTIRTRNIQGILDDGTIRISNRNLHIFFDPPHLLKGLRNNFLNKNIIWEKKTATWKDIEFIYDVDSKLGDTRALPKLTAYHVNPEKIKKMKVSIAAQVFSARTAAMLKYTNEINSRHTGSSSGTMATTAAVVEFIDKLFDSVNGAPHGGKKGKLRKAVKINSVHVSFWNDAILKLKSLKFEDSVSKAAIQAGKPRLVRVPSLDGWVITLESFIRLSKELFEKYGVEYFYPRNLNQDPLENFFGRIRALNYRNVNPDANAFIYAYKSLLITNVLSPHSKSANCEVDHGENIIDFGFLFEDKISNKENEPIFHTECLSFTSQPQSSGSFNREEVMLEKIKVQCSAYTAGYLCRKINKHIKCRSCLNTYTSSSQEGIHAYIKHREYQSLKCDNLVYPNSKMLRTYRAISQKIHGFLEKNGHKTQVGKKLEKIIKNTVEFSWLGCPLHMLIVQNFYIQCLIKLHVHNWCKTVNRILKGGIEGKHVSQNEHIKKLALRKHATYFLRKKALNKQFI